MLVSGIQQGDAVIHMRVSVLFQVLFLLKLLQNMELSSLCYTLGPCWFLSYLFGGDLVAESDSCDLMDCNPLGSSVHGISQGRILEWVSFSRGSSCPGIEPMSPALQADSLPSEPPGAWWVPSQFFHLLRWK